MPGKVCACFSCFCKCKQPTLHHRTFPINPRIVRPYEHERRSVSDQRLTVYKREAKAVNWPSKYTYPSSTRSRTTSIRVTRLIDNWVVYTQKIMILDLNLLNTCVVTSYITIDDPEAKTHLVLLRKINTQQQKMLRIGKHERMYRTGMSRDLCTRTVGVTIRIVEKKL
jgi:hypothetical protein